MTIYEYVSFTQPEVVLALREAGLLIDWELAGDQLTYADIKALMSHDRWERVRGALRQVYRRVIG